MDYIVSEFLVFLAALAALCFLGTCVVILVILARECGQWSVRKLKRVTQRIALSLPTEPGLHFDRYKPR